MSKGGIQTLFGTKQNLQVAVAQAAREAFEEAVTRPARTQPPGAARLRVLVGRWIAYAQEPLFPGGCFWAANLPVFDSQPGPVRDTLARQQRAWRGLIAAELRHAADTAEIAAFDADQVAFQMNAVLTATNTALRLGDDSAVDTARRIINGLLDHTRLTRPPARRTAVGLPGHTHRPRTRAVQQRLPLPCHRAGPNELGTLRQRRQDRHGPQPQHKREPPDSSSLITGQGTPARSICALTSVG